MPESTLLLNALIPIYIVLLLVLVAFTGAQWRQRPDTPSALSFGIFAGSTFCLVLQGLVGQDDGLVVTLTTGTIVLPFMAVIGLVGERSGCRIPYGGWFISTAFGAAGSVVLWSAGSPFQVYAWPQMLGITLPGFYTLSRIRRVWVDPVLPVRWLWWIGLFMLLHQLTFPALRLHENPSVILYAFAVSLILVIVAGLCAPAINAERAGRRTVAVEIERGQLLVRNQAIADYLSRLAHEFRNPLNAIQGYGELIQESIEDGVDATELSSDVERIHRSSMHLTALVDDVLDLAKIEAGRMELRLQSTQPGDLLRDVAATLAPMAEARGNVHPRRNHLPPVGAGPHVDVSGRRRRDRYRCRGATTALSALQPSELGDPTSLWWHGHRTRTHPRAGSRDGGRCHRRQHPG